MDDIYTTPRHTPPHWFVPNAIYMVTGATLYQKPWLDSAEKKRHFCETLMERSSLLSWAIEAWAVMSNHYHFVARAPEDATTLKALVQGIHSISAKFVNKLDRASGRRIWYNYWDSCITHDTSYFARLNYVHQNPVKHGLVEEAVEYPFCSYKWFLDTESVEFRSLVLSQPIDQVNIKDDF